MEIGIEGATITQRADFFTIGYAGRTPDEMVNLLKAAGVSTLVDIRYTPVSMHRPEFSKRNLKRRLEENGVEYLHRPDLGVPRDIRADIVGERNRHRIWQWYDSYVAPLFARKNLDEFFNWAVHPVAFMCVERDPSTCHRHRLAMALERYGLQRQDL